MVLSFFKYFTLSSTLQLREENPPNHFMSYFQINLHILLDGYLIFIFLSIKHFNKVSKEGLMERISHHKIISDFIQKAI